MAETGRRPVEMQDQRVGFDPAIVTNERVQEFYRHWLALKGARAFPAKADFDPSAIPRLLPGTLLLKVVDDPLDFEYRIIGEEIAVRLGQLKGKRVREASLLNAASSAYRNYCAVVEARRPQFLEGSAIVPFRDRPTRVSRVHCPLSADGAKVDHILSYAAFV